ncbi:hypothetical protein ALC57_15077 [Trachymyrmex cornetzi]|uniref:Uncharacterized protein n=1 Tax=Trachymyrmex cornetzi TaxID=471704 RepID=A0A151IXG9_9HYME|nr:hypothetical protein ALC57_15077 [Trachymyrmex cornetzi]
MRHGSHLAIRSNTLHPRVQKPIGLPIFCSISQSGSARYTSHGILLPRWSWETTSWRDSKLRAKPSVVAGEADLRVTVLRPRPARLRPQSQSASPPSGFARGFLNLAESDPCERDEWTLEKVRHRRR